jgi:lysophospholipase L1-like esterase
MKYTRFIVCGDSYSEGMSDEIVNGKYRGWADRVADGLSEGNHNFTYANLAIRGKLLQQVIDDQLPVALSYVTGPETLLSFHAGANDAIRPNYDGALARKRYTEAVRKAAASGATIMLFTVLEETGNKGRTAKLWKERFGAFNKMVREVGAEVCAIVPDGNSGELFKDNRFLAFDRLHVNIDGHFRIAQAVLERLGYPFDKSWKEPLSPMPKSFALKRKLTTPIWIFTFVIPWIIRRLRGKSSGDGRVAKYPMPIRWPMQQI